MTFSVLALTAWPARGQDISNVYMLDGGAFTNALMANSLVERMDWAMVAARQSKVSDSIARPRATVSQPAALAFRPVANIETPRVMASRYPAAKRAEAEAVFRDLLSRFGSLESQYGQPSHDLATAAALFIGSSHEAATGIEFPDGYSLPLIRQLRMSLSADPAIVGASDADKQRLYEQFAIIGMMTGGTTLALKQHPDSVIGAKLKAAGNSYLHQFLKLDPARIRFSERGMILTGSR